MVLKLQFTLSDIHSVIIPIDNYHIDSPDRHLRYSNIPNEWKGVFVHIPIHIE